MRLGRQGLRIEQGGPAGGLVGHVRRALRNDRRGDALTRFFQQSQFKRSAMPNAPKVGSGGSLSPRGDWRAPSDAYANAWLAELEGVPDVGP